MILSSAFVYLSINFLLHYHFAFRIFALFEFLLSFFYLPLSASSVLFISFLPFCSLSHLYVFFESLSAHFIFYLHLLNLAYFFWLLIIPHSFSVYLSALVCVLLHWLLLFISGTCMRWPYYFWCSGSFVIICCQFPIIFSFILSKFFH